MTPKSADQILHIYTDGSCLNNPGPGGWAALIRLGEKTIRIQDGAVHTTNNRMELTGVIEALIYVREHFAAVDTIEVYSDSSWVVNTMSQNWKRKKNLDLWERLMPLVQGKRIRWNWVRGHNGHKENEDCDKRALKEAIAFAKEASRMNPEDLPSFNNQTSLL